MNNVYVNELSRTPLEKQKFEICERKGMGHPDTICDSIMNQVSIELSKEYKTRFGVILHHNVDKCLLGAGESQPSFNGGKIINPMSIIFGDRATYRVGEELIDVQNIAERTANEWFKKNFRFVKPEHLKFQNQILPGSMALQDIFSRKLSTYLGANDTSATVGYAPLTFTEKAVIWTEQVLNDYSYKLKHPEVGEDIKIMAVRKDNEIDFTVAIAMVDQFIANEDDYFKKKEEIRGEITDLLLRYGYDDANVTINALDVKGRETDGLYLTVLGTSAEAGDSGQVGRGNDVRGIIPLNRPASSEAAAGKNPNSHVGKIYNVFGHYLADIMVNKISEIDEAYVWLVSQIGQPINIPKVASVQYIPKPYVKAEDKINISNMIDDILQREFEHLDKFCDSLIEGVTVC